MERIRQINENCIYCGRSLIGMSQPDKRKYCGATCNNKYRLRQKKPDVQSKLWQHDPEVFESAMEMYWSGYGGAAIARHYGIPANTVYSWIHDFGKCRIRMEPEFLPKIIQPAIRSPKKRFKDAESVGEWLEALRENVATSEESSEDVPIRLVCGVLHGQSAGKLAGVIPESLKEDPLSGISYAFCNKGRDTITIIAWKAPVYVLSKYVKTRGTFIWPHGDLGATIEVAKTEFERLLFLEKSKKASRIMPEIQS
jgi:transposase-like protein